MILGQYRAFMPLYIAQSEDLDRCYRCLTNSLTHSLTTLIDSATQLLIKYKSGALVTQQWTEFKQIFRCFQASSSATVYQPPTHPSCKIAKSRMSWTLPRVARSPQSFSIWCLVLVPISISEWLFLSFVLIHSFLNLLFWYTLWCWWVFLLNQH